MLHAERDFANLRPSLVRYIISPRGQSKLHQDDVPSGDFMAKGLFTETEGWAVNAEYLRILAFQGTTTSSPA
jgi:hypothetical protein